jgi:translation initiation factor 1
MLTICFTTERNGRKTLTTVQGLPKKFDQKKILKVIKKKFGMCLVTCLKCLSCPNTNCIIACNGTIVTDTEMGEVIQLQGDQRKDVQEFLTDKDGLELDAKTIKVCCCPAFPFYHQDHRLTPHFLGPRFLIAPPTSCLVPVPSSQFMLPRERWDRKHPPSAGRTQYAVLAFTRSNVMLSPPPLCAWRVRPGPLSK